MPAWVPGFGVPGPLDGGQVAGLAREGSVGGPWVGVESGVGTSGRFWGEGDSLLPAAGGGQDRIVGMS